MQPETSYVQKDTSFFTFDFEKLERTAKRGLREIYSLFSLIYNGLAVIFQFTFFHAISSYKKIILSSAEVIRLVHVQYL